MRSDIANAFQRQTDLWSYIQGKVNCFSNDELQKHFDVTVTRDRLAEHQSQLKKCISEAETKETELLTAAATFAHCW